ncbi:MAG: M3 family peptidase, partial [Myxococcales bacterium]|nr:M3 family peptidase [Myxococcales bacterium]
MATTPALRDAYNGILPKVSAFYSAIPLHAGLWKALTDFAATDEARALEGPRARLLERTLDDFRRHGAELDAEGKARISAIDVEMATLTNTFSQHVLDATNAYELIVTDEARLSGLPASAKAAARASAKGKGKEGFRFTLQAPSVTPVLMYADDASLRREIWEAFTRRGTAPPHDNQPLIADILRLRREKANLLGYKDFSDLVLSERMAKDGASAAAFVERLREETAPHAARESAELLAFRKTVDGGETLAPWDVSYFAEKERQALYDFDEEELRPYFPAKSVLEGVFQTVQTLYNVRFERTTLPTWNEDVQTYRMVDESGAHRGSFYVDLY